MCDFQWPACRCRAVGTGYRATWKLSPMATTSGPHDEPNPYDHNQGSYGFSLNLLGLWKLWKDDKRKKLKDRLAQSREQYRKAWRKKS